MCSKLLIKLLLCTYFLQVNTAYVPAKVCNEGEVCCHVQSLGIHWMLMHSIKGQCVVKARLWLDVSHYYFVIGMILLPGWCMVYQPVDTRWSAVWSQFKIRFESTLFIATSAWISAWKFSWISLRWGGETFPARGLAHDLLSWMWPPCCLSKAQILTS